MISSQFTKSATRVALSFLLAAGLIPVGLGRAYAEPVAIDEPVAETIAAGEGDSSVTNPVSPEVAAATDEFIAQAEAAGAGETVEDEAAAAAAADFSDITDADADGIIIVLESEATDDLLSGEAAEVVDEVEAGITLMAEVEAEGIDLLEDAPLADELEASGIIVDEATPFSDGSVMVTADIPEELSFEDAIAQAEAIEGVAYAQPNFYYNIMDGMEESPVTISSAPLYDSSSELLAITNDTFARYSVEKSYYEGTTGGNAYWLYNTNAIEAWDYARANNSVTVAVFDTGCRLDHVELKDNVLADLAYDAFNEKKLTVNDFNDTPASRKAGRGAGDAHYHGTHVSGIIAARANNGRGIAGISYNANIIPVKVTNDDPIAAGGNTGTQTSHFIKGFEYLFGLIDSGKRKDIRVVNISMGGYIAESKSYNDPKLEAAIKTAKNKYNILTVCAAGNGTGTGPRCDTIYPSDFPEVISVTNLNPNGTNYKSTDYNQQKDISAPGVNIYSTYSKSTTQYTLLTGSSMAAPVVAGACALLAAAKPSATASDIENAILSTAKQINRYNNYFPSSKSESKDGIWNGSKGALDVNAAMRVIKNIQPKTFTDVKSKDWFYNDVRNATSVGYISGISGGSTFQPNKPITRADVMVILYRMANMQNTTKRFSTSKFSDVKDSKLYYYQPITWAAELEIAKGVGDTGKFQPTSYITRQDFCVLLYRYAQKSNTLTRPTTAEINSMMRRYPDGARVGTYAAEAVTYLCKLGIFGSDTRLRPTDTISRAEVAKMVYKLQPRMYVAQLIPIKTSTSTTK